MLSVILLWIVPVPATAGMQELLPGITGPKQPPNPVNVVLNDPRSTKRYSAFAVQLPPKANSAPPPTVQPIFVTRLLKFQSGQVPKMAGAPIGTLQVGEPPTTSGTAVALAEAELSISIRP